MAYKNDERPKMPVSIRAKQFMPFSALAGYEDSLREIDMERERQPKPNITEDLQDELNRALKNAVQGRKVVVNYYDGRRVVKYEGVLEHIDIIKGYTVIGGRKVDLDDIYDWTNGA